MYLSPCVCSTLEALGLLGNGLDAGSLQAFSAAGSHFLRVEHLILDLKIFFVDGELRAAATHEPPMLGQRAAALPKTIN